MYNQKEKICTLYASDEHFITILIPYIYEIINEDKEIITIFERDLSNTAEKVLKCIKEKNKKTTANKPAHQAALPWLL